MAFLVFENISICPMAFVTNSSQQFSEIIPQLNNFCNQS